MLRRLIRHASNYTFGSLLVTLASIISFPIFTRSFSVAEYGALNLISSALLLLTGIGKLGLQQSIARFHAEVIAGNREITESSYLSTVVAGMAFTGLLATLGWVILTLVVPSGWWRDERVAALVLPVSALILVRVLDSAVSNILQALQRSALFSAYAVLRKYAGLVLILAVMFYVLPQVAGFYLGTLIAEAGALLLMLGFLARRYELSARKFDPQTFKSMLAFGLPMVAYELSGLILDLSDRYVIQAKIGAEAVGQYSAAYNLCEYLKIIMVTSFAQAFTPMYIKTWEKDGEAQTRKFIDSALRLYLLAAMPILAGISVVGEELITLLASAKYAAGAVAIPYVIAGMLVDGGIPIFAAGIYIRKQNHKIIPFVATAAALNIGLNLLLIPYLGIVAAALTTLISYLFVAASAWWLGAQSLRIDFPLRAACKFGLFSICMYAVCAQIALPVLWLNLLAKVLVGVCMYGLLVVLFDQPTRELLQRFKAVPALRT